MRFREYSIFLLLCISLVSICSGIRGGGFRSGIRSSSSSRSTSRSSTGSRSGISRSSSSRSYYRSSYTGSFRSGSRYTSVYIQTVPSVRYSTLYTAAYLGSYHRYYPYYYSYGPTYRSNHYTYRNDDKLCANYETNISSNSIQETMGIFKCPLSFVPSNFTECCGEDYAEFCCEPSASNGVGTFWIIIIVLILLAFISLICVIKHRSKLNKTRRISKESSTIVTTRTVNKHAETRTDTHPPPYGFQVPHTSEHVQQPPYPPPNYDSTIGFNNAPPYSIDANMSAQYPNAMSGNNEHPYAPSFPQTMNVSGFPESYGAPSQYPPNYSNDLYPSNISQRPMIYNNHQVPFAAYDTSQNPANDSRYQVNPGYAP